ncbi:TonB-dependent siderophore receptor [Terriglobus albidus]|uniref:TonB-dependent siderophore receptor n=1 Tax=Terriglobus albidus TaxID=1592106 RepID=A0A5B9EI04_9BACT|nr:TonB-dependent siderophore receptor [Terriglobus albidus]QEE30470.1 TonB-dependent siderophore receptor [Terriglobus albidus]
MHLNRFLTRAYTCALLLLLCSAAIAEDKSTTPDTTEDENPPVACAQTPGSPSRILSGVVTDPSGAGVAHAQLTLTCDSFRVTATTDSAGTYTLTAPAGNYRLLVEAATFGNASQDVTLTDASTVVNPVVRLGQVHSVVTVTGENEYSVSVASGGTKTDLPLSEVPQAITVINRDLMNAQNVVKLDDALRNVAGVMAGGYYDGWDYYRIRGFDASFNTYIDGLRGGNGMSEETWGLESVEVLKGPSSALYGQSVLGGLVNIVTRKPIPDRFAHVQLTAGSFNFLDPAIDVGGSLNSSRTVYGRLAALYHSANTFVDHTYRHRYYLAPSLTWRPTAATSLTLIGRVQRDNGRQGMPLPAVGTVLPNPNGLLPINVYNGELDAHANQLAQANQQFGYQFRHTFSDRLLLRQNSRFAWYQQHWNRIYYPSFLGADQRTLYRYPLDWDGPWQTHDIDTNMEAKGSFWGMEHSALLGVDFYRNPANSRGWSIDFSDLSQYEPLDLYAPKYGANPYRALQLYTSSNTVTQYTGIYLQDHIRLPRHVTITGGGRVDFAKNESKGSPNQNSTGLTPRLGVTWQFIPSTSIYGSFSKSFMPQSGMVYDGSTSGHFIAPERGQQWEGGAKSTFFGGRLLTTLAIFQLNRNNVATSDPAHANFYLVTGQQRSRGVELEATLHPLAGWNVTSAYSYINAEVTHDTTLPAGTPTLNAPKHLFNLWTTYEIPRGKIRGLTFGAGGRHFTNQSGDLANTFQLPGYGLVDASISYRRGPAMWQLNANNIGNKRYYSGSYNDLYVKPGEPRVIRGTVSWNF